MALEAKTLNAYSVIQVLLKINSKKDLLEIFFVLAVKDISID